MDLSLKENKATEYKDENTFETPPVEASESSGANISEQTECTPPVEASESSGASISEQTECTPPVEASESSGANISEQTECTPPVEASESSGANISEQTECIPPVKASESSGANISEQTDNEAEKRTFINQENLPSENQTNEMCIEKKSPDSDKIKEDDNSEKEDKTLGATNPEGSDISDGENKPEGVDNAKESDLPKIGSMECDNNEEVTDVGDLETQTMKSRNVEEFQSENSVTIEQEKNIESENRVEIIVSEQTENLKGEEETSLEEEQESCVEKNEETQTDGDAVVEEVKDLSESNEMKTEVIVTNGKEGNIETKEENCKEVELDENEEIEEEEEESISMPPENLFEYQWPPDRMGEWYFVQEQICEYLGVTSFKRKYPDLERRVMEMKEKEFLRERGVVTEEQVTLGLTALKSEDVYDLMARDYNKKYTDYLKVLQEKERQNISNKHKEYEATTMDTEKVKEFTQRAVKQAAEYNASLMRERREERQYFLDMQTMVVQVSKNRVKQIKKDSTKVDGYPVALIPGQFQNFYRKYTPEELNYFPLQTALYGPVELQDQQRLGRPGWEDEEQPVSDISEPGSPEPPAAVPTVNVPPPAMPMLQLETPQKNQQLILETYKPKEIDDAICGLCLKDKSCNKFNLPEELIHCAQCDNSGHPSCLEMNSDLVNVIKTYPWQCMECKTCFCCGQPTDEDKMMFCDDCDRGYHTFCVGLQEIPTGKWACQSCLSAQAKEKELAAAAILAAAAAATPTPERSLASTPSATPPPTKRRRSVKKRDL